MPTNTRATANTIMSLWSMVVSFANGTARSARHPHLDFGSGSLVRLLLAQTLMERLRSGGVAPGKTAAAF